jgi:hypothetical protein
MLLHALAIVITLEIPAESGDRPWEFALPKAEVVPTAVLISWEVTGENVTAGTLFVGQGEDWLPMGGAPFEASDQWIPSYFHVFSVFLLFEPIVVTGDPESGWRGPWSITGGEVRIEYGLSETRVAVPEPSIVVLLAASFVLLRRVLIA